jgi:hypothetical protein
MLRCFIDHGRKLLLVAGDDDNPFLFTGRFGVHIDSGHLSQQSAKLIARRTHVVGATGHKSRHASVKLTWQRTLAIGDGKGIPATGIETTRRFYALVTQVRSSKRVQKSMGKR